MRIYKHPIFTTREHFHFGEKYVPSGIRVKTVDEKVELTKRRNTFLIEQEGISLDPLMGAVNALVSVSSPYARLNIRESLDLYGTELVTRVLNLTSDLRRGNIALKLFAMSFQGMTASQLRIEGGNLLQANSSIAGGFFNAVKVQIALAQVARELCGEDLETFRKVLETNRHCALELAHLNIGVFGLFLNKLGIQTNQTGNYQFDPDQFEIFTFGGEKYLLPKKEFLDSLIEEANDPNKTFTIRDSSDNVVREKLLIALQQGTFGCIILDPRLSGVAKKFFDAIDDGIQKVCGLVTAV